MLSAAPGALFAETPADTLVIADAIDDIVSLDPHEAYEFSGLDVVNNTYDGLIELDPTQPGVLVPGLAESWSASEDGKTFTFKMKPGVTFSSGNPVRAEDAAFSLQRAVKLNLTPAFILNQFGWTAENVDQMVTADGDTVTMKTDQAYAPTFLYNCLTAGVASIVDKETVMANEAERRHGQRLAEEQLGRHRCLRAEIVQAERRVMCWKRVRATGAATPRWRACSCSTCRKRQRSAFRSRRATSTSHAN